MVKSANGGRSLEEFASLAVNHNGTLLATCCTHDKAVKVFDVPNFDMINMITFPRDAPFTPKTLCWVHQGRDTKAIFQRWRS